MLGLDRVVLLLLLLLLMPSEAWVVSRYGAARLAPSFLPSFLTATAPSAVMLTLTHHD
jgi:hypothetical protein